MVERSNRTLKEYYSAEKNNGMLKFAGKWMELEEIILSEVTQSQNVKHDMYSLICGPAL